MLRWGRAALLECGLRPGSAGDATWAFSGRCTAGSDVTEGAGAVELTFSGAGGCADATDAVEVPWSDSRGCTAGSSVTEGAGAVELTFSGAEGSADATGAVELPWSDSGRCTAGSDVTVAIRAVELILFGSFSKSAPAAAANAAKLIARRSQVRRRSLRFSACCSSCWIRAATSTLSLFISSEWGCGDSAALAPDSRTWSVVAPGGGSASVLASGSKKASCLFRCSGADAGPPPENS